MFKFNKQEEKFVQQDDLFAISSNGHKTNAIFFDKIVPLHSNRKVPYKYRNDCSFEIVEEWPPIRQIVELIYGLQNGSKN